MCTKEKVTTEQKTLTVFRKSNVRKNDRIRSFFDSFSRRRYAGSLMPIRTWATTNRNRYDTRAGLLYVLCFLPIASTMSPGRSIGAYLEVYRNIVSDYSAYSQYLCLITPIRLMQCLYRGQQRDTECVEGGRLVGSGAGLSQQGPGQSLSRK